MKSSPQEVKKPVMDAEETTELCDVATREPNAVKMGDIEEPNEGRNDEETRVQKTFQPSSDPTLKLVNLPQYIA